MNIADNLTAIRKRLSSATQRSHRDWNAVELMGVTKTKPVEDMIAAHHAGLEFFGENYVQEYEAKKPQMPAGARVHLIGHLQSNKAAKAVEIFDGIDSVDSLKLAQRLQAAAAKIGKTLPILLEINVGGEESKSGLTPDSAELEQILQSAREWPNLRLQGLMSIPPFLEPEEMRPYHRQLRALCDRINERVERGELPGVRMDVLSMGMSNDFEVAIEEGSTRVRIGTAIFGKRAPKS